MKNKKYLYFSFIFIFVVACVLTASSFSYNDDSIETEIEVEEDIIDNRVISDNLWNNYIELDSHESIDIEIYLVSNSTVDTNYIIYYIGDELIDVTSNELLEGTIKSNGVISYNITVSNYADYTNKVYIDVLSSNINNNIELTENKKEVANE